MASSNGSESRPLESDQTGELESAAAIRERLKQHRREIIQSINPDELVHDHAMHELLGFDLVEDVVRGDRSARKKAEMILHTIESQDNSALLRFVQCLESEHDHLGHAFVAKRLLGTGLSDEMMKEMDTSYKYMMQCRRNAKRLRSDIDCHTLVPHLQAEQLLTGDEVQQLSLESMTRQKKNSLLLALLETKGPTAHMIFVQCLEKDDENPSHQELLQQLFDAAGEEVQCDGSGVKRKAIVQLVSEHTCKVPKFTPKQTMASGVIVSQRYLNIVKEVHEFQYNGNSEAAITKVETYRLSGQTELYVALMCRNWYAYVTCKSPQQIEGMAEEAKKLLASVDGDNRHVLESRCEWMLSKYYYYKNNKEKSEQHIDRSMVIQGTYHVAQGEDTLLTHYGKACVLLEKLAEQWSPELAGEAEHLIENANDSAMESGDFGVYLSHHQLRLAQLCLHSSSTHPGVCSDPKTLERAASIIDSIDMKSLSQRTKCLLYIIKSDYHRNIAECSEAMKCAKEAHRIAASSGFMTELDSVSRRFEALTVDHKE